MNHRIALSLSVITCLLSLVEGLLNPTPPRRRSYQRRSITTTGNPSTSHRNNAAVTDDDDHEEYLVEVTYEGRSCQVSIRPSETILSGLERARVMDQLAIPELPSDCRRGNCLTCVGRHIQNSEISSLQRGEDGLSPEMSKQISNKGYVLTCSSRIVGDGVRLELGENYKAWKDMYYDRLYDESTQYISRSAMARTIRLSDERNPELWAVKTETALNLSSDDE